MEPRRVFDLIVVGGGTAGCVVAARASEDPTRQVLLVEAGPDPRPIPDMVSDPRRQSELLEGSGFIRSFGVRRPDGSEFPLISGRIMGGGSSVNNLAVARPMACDFAAWEPYGGKAWSYQALLPLMRAIEDDPDFANSPIHGSGGPLRLHRDFRLGDALDPPGRALIDAARAMGLPACPDLNSPEPFGICDSPYNVADGRRQSTAVAYLEPARRRPNLSILAETLVRRLVMDGHAVRGVELSGSSARGTFHADEVVLAAGVFHSPQILMLSGIGPIAALERHGVTVRHSRLGVGAGYQDHAVAFVGFQPTDLMQPGFAIPKLRFVIRSDTSYEHPDLHVLVHGPERRGRDRSARMSLSVRLLEHRSRGRVSLASSDPEDLPIVDHALLADPDDIRAMVDGIGFVKRLTNHPGVAQFLGPMLVPGTRGGWRAHVLRTFVSYHHGTSTCRLGPAEDPFAVVDATLRLHGIDNLRVADASVLPTIPHANTNLAAILVGEVAAGQIAAA